MARNQHLVMWRNLSAPGAEYCMLQRPSGSWELTGTIITLAGGEPVTVAYTVSVNNLWQTQAVLVILTKGNLSMSKVWMVEAEQQRWYVAGDEVRKLRGCTDADLGMTPATNTIPVRRLQLELGASVAVDGVCLTVAVRDAEVLAFDAVPETLRRTTLGRRKAG
ncbi:MAG: putative glycolipid-binding domain-containing protein, partial [Anaerolineales bacterium]